MAFVRPHLALTVSDVERSIPFYRALFGVGRRVVGGVRDARRRGARCAWGIRGGGAILLLAPAPRES